MTGTRPVIALTHSSLTSTNGSILNLAANSQLLVTGDLFSLSNRSTLQTLNGPLIRVANGSTLYVTGALASFLGMGNLISVTNSLCTSGCTTINGITVKFVGTGNSVWIGPTPLKGT